MHRLPIPRLPAGLAGRACAMAVESAPSHMLGLCRVDQQLVWPVTEDTKRLHELDCSSNDFRHVIQTNLRSGVRSPDVSRHKQGTASIGSMNLSKSHTSPASNSFLAWLLMTLWFHPVSLGCNQHNTTCSIQIELLWGSNMSPSLKRASS